MASTENNGTVSRVLQLLRCFADGPVDRTLSELSDELSLPRSTVHRLLALLREQGFVAADTLSHRYQPGAEFYRISAILAARMPIVQLATPLLRKIVGQCDETALLGTVLAERLQMSYVAQVESTKPMRYVIDLNVPHSLMWGATGRAILAHLGDEAVAKVWERNDPSPAGHPRPTRKVLREDLAKIRANGYSYTRGQRIPTAIGLAVPFFSATGSVLGTLMLTIPQTRFTASAKARFVRLLQDGASKLSESLGWRDARAATTWRELSR